MWGFSCINADLESHPASRSLSEDIRRNNVDGDSNGYVRFSTAHVLIFLVTLLWKELIRSLASHSWWLNIRSYEATST